MLCCLKNAPGTHRNKFAGANIVFFFETQAKKCAFVVIFYALRQFRAFLPA